MKGNEKDVRTIDKLINGKNNTYDERNMWLAPYIYCSQKGAIEKRCIQFASDCELDNNYISEFHLSIGFEESNRIFVL